MMPWRAGVTDSRRDVKLVCRKETVAPGIVQHAFEAVYAISLVPDEQTHWPAPTSLSPRMAAVARFILAEPQEESQ